MNQWGCPHCNRLQGRSLQEVRLAFELRYHFDFDVDDRNVSNPDGRDFEVDIFIRSLNLVIEFDGRYWHRNKQDSDRAKAQALRALGYRVIRVREEPLKMFHRDDLVVPYLEKPHRLARMTLEHFQERFQIDVPHMRERLETNGPLATDKFDEYIQGFRTQTAGDSIALFGPEELAALPSQLSFGFIASKEHG